MVTGLVRVLISCPQIRTLFSGRSIDKLLSHMFEILDKSVTGLHAELWSVYRCESVDNVLRWNLVLSGNTKVSYIRTIFPLVKIPCKFALVTFDLLKTNDPIVVIE